VVKTTEIPVLASPDFTCKSLQQHITMTKDIDDMPVVSTPLILWGAAESGVTIMAASIPVLRTLFRDLNTISRKYYLSESKNATQGSRVVSKYADTNLVVISAGGPYSEHMTKGSSNSSSNGSPLRDSYGQILQSTEVRVAVEYRKGERDEML